MNLDILMIIIVFLLLLNIGVVVFFLRKKEEKRDDTGFSLLLEQMNNLNRTVDSKISDTQRTVSESMKDQFSESQRLVDKFLKEMTSMTEKVTRVEETGKQMVSFAGELQNLQDILKNPKQRGILGEYYLETLLKNVLPPGSFQMQYPFKDGTIVDAVVFVKEKVIPIDSKFSLENYNRLVEERDPLEKERLEKVFKSDLKMRIDETAKYVKPSENTMDFAFMFIPHEAIYYDLLVSQVGAVKVNTRDLVEYAFKEKRVIIVSPTSFLAYLQTVLQGLKALQIEESAKEIRHRIEDLGRHLKAYEDFFRSIGNSLGTTVNHYNKASKELSKIDKDVFRITGESMDLSPVEVEKPLKNEDFE